jgi:Ca2+-binding RTX toxin-like protein
MMLEFIEGQFDMVAHANAAKGLIGVEGLGLSALTGVTDTPANDSFTVTSGLASLRGTRGNDALVGGVGADLIYGGGGDDIIYGGLGQDRIYGGNGHDTVFGSGGDDLLFGGRGNDLVVGDSFVDDLSPDEVDRGSDTLFGGAGDDRVLGRLENDLLFGGAGGDFFICGTGNDTIYGGAGNDRTLVSNGDDDLFGGAGNDTLTDGLGADDFTGGAGADSFLYLIDDDVDRDEGGPTAGYGVGDDRIFDFRLGDRDVVDINLSLANNVTVADIVDSGTNTVFVLSYGEVITLIGFSGQNFEDGLRFDSVDDINALSQQMYGYDAVLLSGFD